MMIMKGKDGRTCDERCYNAKWQKCTCICGGKNHGKGLKHAIEHNTLSGKSFKELATDELRKDALL